MEDDAVPESAKRSWKASDLDEVVVVDVPFEPLGPARGATELVGPLDWVEVRDVALPVL